MISKSIKYDLIVVGGGILGIFHTFHAIKKGLKVLLIEKDNPICGATVRNFGQIIPSGLNSYWSKYGVESVAIYNELQKKDDFSIRKNGSTYIASNNEELQLLEELHLHTKGQSKSKLLSKKETVNKIEGLQPNYCQGSLFFPEELTIDSQLFISKFYKVLKNHIVFSKVIQTDETNNCCKTILANGEVFDSKKIIICNGAQINTLYPKVFETSAMRVTKLQMLQTKGQGIYNLKGNVLTGLTIRRYESFAACKSYNKIKSKEDKNSFENKFGIHILFKQSLDGSIIIGDSHTYHDIININLLGFEQEEAIDNFIINESKKIINLPNYAIAKRWFGIYTQTKDNTVFEYKPSPNIVLLTGIGGKGMTVSPSFAKEKIDMMF